jgi:hypothetical protein
MPFALSIVRDLANLKDSKNSREVLILAVCSDLVTPRNPPDSRLDRLQASGDKYGQAILDPASPSLKSYAHDSISHHPASLTQRLTMASCFAVYL